MIRLHAPSRFLFAVAALLAAAGSHAQGSDRPAVLKALEARGLRVVEEFKVGGDLRAFAGVAGDQPVAIYVTRDGNAIVGARLDAEGKPLDEAKLEALVSKPMGDQAWAQLEKSTWVLDGKKDAPRIIYTFSDANCPYCHKFWEAARPWVDSGKVQLRHVLVGVIRQDSPAKAAAILGAADPSAALLENEHKFNAGGITPAKSVPDNIGKMLDDNQALMVSLGFRGTSGIVVRDDARLRGVRDLKGKKIALGAQGSAVRATLEAVLAAHGLQAGRDYEAVPTPFTASLPALNAGTIDAAAQVIGIPATPLRDALTQAHLKLLPLDPAAVKALAAQDDALMPLGIPAGTYPNQPDPVATIGTAALLLTTSDLTRDEALQVVRAVYQTGQDLLAAGSPQGAQVNVANARRGLTVPLHDGAEEGLAALENAKPR